MYLQKDIYVTQRRLAETAWLASFSEKFSLTLKFQNKPPIQKLYDISAFFPFLHSEIFLPIWILFR